MRIVIVGAGEVGYSVARNLSADGHDIVIVEEDEERAAQAEETLDVMVVNGNGARPSVLAKAGITGKKVRRHDAHRLHQQGRGQPHGLLDSEALRRTARDSARVGLEFTDNESWANDLGIDMLVSPERSVAKDIEELLEVRAALHTTEIAGGRAGIYLFRVAQDSPLCGLPLYEIRKRNPNMIMLVVWVKSGDDSFVPKASYALQPGDLCYTMCYRSQILEIERLFQPAKSKRLKRVFIIGAGKIGHQTAERLLAHIRGIDLRIVDEDRAKCEKFAGELPRAMILCGNGADAEFLKSEGITDADGCVAATEHDETNLMLAVLAKTLGVSKSIAVVRNHNYLGMTSHIPVDAIVNRNQTLADVITRSVRYPGTSNVLTVLEEISAEAVETTVVSGSPADGKKLMELTMPEGSLIGLLDRGGEMLIPTGQTELRGGDKIISSALPPRWKRRSRFSDRSAPP